jgi:uncharacterized membrane protein YedE/YeeE
MTEFTPLSGLWGGVLIGLGSVGLLLGLGRIAGISGIFGHAVLPVRGDWGWRAAFLLGLLLGAALAILWVPSAADFEITRSPAVLAAGGLLVGFGTQLGSGCTSGHGVCGLARMSRRSLVAVPVFMATAAATVGVARHLLGGS